MIVAISNHMVTRIPRYSSSHDEHHNTWTLHLKGAQPEDAGRYMCQVNSSPMLTQVGFVEIVGKSRPLLNLDQCSDESKKFELAVLFFALCSATFHR